MGIVPALQEFQLLYLATLENLKYIRLCKVCGVLVPSVTTLASLTLVLSSLALPPSSRSPEC